jgi:hypothetical protein
MNASQHYAIFTADFHHKHYLGATQEFEILEELNGMKGFFIKVFFVNDKVNLNGWQITWEGIKQDIKDVVGVPIVQQNDMRHPTFTIQNLFAKGYIVDFTLDEEKHEASVIARILDAGTIKLIQEGKLKFVSPAVVARDNLSIEEINGVDVLSRWIALHLALVADPAYGKKDAKITETCTGTGHSCSMQLKGIPATMVAELLKVGDCVSEKIPVIMNENPKMEHEQAVAIAISMCEDKTADTEQIIKREHELLDKGIPEKEVHDMLVKEFGAENIPGSDSQKVGPLTQTPLMKKLNASLNRLTSEFNQMVRQAGMPEHDGSWGYWFIANDMDVFVANGQTVDEAITSQCGCQKNKHT